MSRGLGWLQRTVLQILEAQDRRMDTFEITATTYSVEQDADGNRRWGTDAQHTAVRRALRRLAKQGKAVKLGRGYIRSRRYWANARFGTYDRINDLIRCRNSARGLEGNEAHELASLLKRAEAMGIDWRKSWPEGGKK
jgi:hypothetical protein